MPIFGLTDRASLDPRFVEIGRIRKGAAKSGGRVGQDLDYFRYVPNARYPKSAEGFLDIYGAEPDELEVHVPFDQMERVFSSWRVRYNQARLCTLRCDGANWHDWIEGNQHRHSKQGRPCDLPCKDVENKCPDCALQYSGKLSIILRPMWMAGHIGLITVITSSINDIAHLAAKLVLHEPLRNKPFMLWRAPERIGVPIKDKRAGVDKSLLHLELTKERMMIEFETSRQNTAAQLTATLSPAPPPQDAEYEEYVEDGLPPRTDMRGTPPDADAREELREVQEEEAKPALVPVPDDLAPGNLVDRAVRDLGFRSVGSAMNAMLAIYQDSKWLTSGKWKAPDAWRKLQEYLADTAAD